MAKKLNIVEAEKCRRGTILSHCPQHYAQSINGLFATCADSASCETQKEVKGKIVRVFSHAAIVTGQPCEYGLQVVHGQEDTVTNIIIDKRKKRIPCLVQCKLSDQRPDGGGYRLCLRAHRNDKITSNC